MKTAAIIVLTLVGFHASAATKGHKVLGEPARMLMESLAAAGFPVSNLQQDWTLKNDISIVAPAITCHYTATLPDEWMSAVNCQVAPLGGNGPILANPLALAQNIRPYAYGEAGVGNRWLSVESIQCTLLYASRDYACEIIAEENVP